METDIRYIGVSPVQMNDLWAFQTADGILKFTLPGVPGIIRAKAIRPRRYSDTEYTWVGQIVDVHGQIIGSAISSSISRKGGK